MHLKKYLNENWNIVLFLTFLRNMLTTADFVLVLPINKICFIHCMICQNPASEMNSSAAEKADERINQTITNCHPDTPL